MRLLNISARRPEHGMSPVFHSCAWCRTSQAEGHNSQSVRNKRVAFQADLRRLCSRQLAALTQVRGTPKAMAA